MIWEKGGVFFAAGTVSKKAELKTTTTGKTVCKFSANVGKDSSGNTIYVNSTAWNSLAGYCADLEKGDPVACAGRVTEREYNGKTYKDYVLDWCNSPAIASAASAPSISPQIPAEIMEMSERSTARDNGKQKFTEVNEEDELPF